MAAIEQFLEGPILADWVRSPMAALRQANLKSLGLADRELSGKLYVSFGHVALIGECWKQPFELTSAPTTADLTIAAVGGAAPH